MKIEVSAIVFIGASLFDDGWCSCSPPRVCVEAVRAFSGQTLHRHTLRARGPLVDRLFAAIRAFHDFMPTMTRIESMTLEA
jgi:hypothetical protein